ncbi:hypothetical protein F5887DRAFT_988717 [Amanita rubescens]|nr:hypothetical protein F5887DRAFT_988717 [Amanita rubescens]
MDFLDVGHVNQSHSEEGNSEVPSAIRGVLIQKREALNSLKHEIARIEEDIVRLGTALAPHNHNLLPNEILGRIFILVARDHGTVQFPISKGKTPPQLTISHVCPHWRRVALRTSELWSDTQLLVYRLDTRNHGHNIRLHQRWILRAGTFPVTVSIRFLQGSGDVALILQRVLLPLQIRRLHLDLTYEQFFMALSELPETALSSSSELELDLALPPDGEAIDANNLPIITRLRSLTFSHGELGSWFDQFSLSLPLGRLRSLKFSIFLVDLQPIFHILRQTPELQVLHFQVSRHQADQFDKLKGQEIALPSVRELSILFQPKFGIELDMVLRRFTCPSLTRFTLNTFRSYCTGETLGILKQQYNMQRIQDVELHGSFALPVSSILQDAPALRTLSLSSNEAIMDDKAIIGISNGTLGRSLTTLKMYLPCDPEEIDCKWL